MIILGACQFKFGIEDMKLQLAVCVLAALVAMTFSAPFGDSSVRKFTTHRLDSNLNTLTFYFFNFLFPRRNFQNLILSNDDEFFT